jgi:hypothetical protein
MPGLNRRGPNGEGAMTGRRQGRCNPENKGKTEEDILKSRESIAPRGRGLGHLGGGFRHGKGMGFGNQTH